jgi:hypothetical protein
VKSARRDREQRPPSHAIRSPSAFVDASNIAGFHPPQGAIERANTVILRAVPGKKRGITIVWRRRYLQG